MFRHLRLIVFLFLVPLTAVMAAAMQSTEPGQAKPRERQPPPAERQAQPREQQPPPSERQAQPRERRGEDDAERRGTPSRPHPDHRPPSVVVRGRVFVGGYFYDPVFGRYPWWPPTAYPYWYAPILDARAEIRIRATPKDAAVYVDGFYAGFVDDFDGVFQRLPLTPGGHHLTLYLEGYRTTSRSVYLRPGSTFTLHESLLRLPPGQRSAPPYVAPPLPPPPTGSYAVPPPLPYPPPPSPAVPAAGDPGTLDLYVQPANAEVRIDGQPWVSSEPGHFLIQVVAGRHRIEIAAPGFQAYAGDLEVRAGAATPLNVSLMRAP